MNIDKDLIIPVGLSILISILNGIHNRYKINRSGMVIAEFRHSIIDMEEVITHIVMLIIFIMLAIHFRPKYLQVIFMTAILGAISKFKMSQNITLTEKGVLIKGKYESWKNIKNIDIKENNLVDITSKNTEYKIVRLENAEYFIRLTKSYYENQKEY